jgi:hypothetical protein
MALQIVYVLTNPAMPGLVKIGKTYSEDVGSRMAQLYTTGLPFPFDVRFACKVPNADEVERAFHVAFGPYRVNPKREFFKIDPDQAIAILKLMHVVEATDLLESSGDEIPAEDKAAGVAFAKRRPRMDFTEMGIAPGSELYFRDDSSSKVTVVDNRFVKFDGEQPISLTAATRRLRGLDPKYALQPGPYWLIGDQLLSDRYEEIYELPEN